jgi:hypothetical protein
MKTRKKIISMILICMLGLSSLSLTVSAATEFNKNITGTSETTIMTKTAKLRKVNLYVTVCDVSCPSFWWNPFATPGDVDYELYAPYYSEEFTGRTGTYYFNPYNGTTKTYYLTAQCEDTSDIATIQGSYDWYTMP